MKNSTLIRIKVPKALYESALRKALLEASDKESKDGHKSKKYAKDDDYDKKVKSPNPAKKHKDIEPKKGGGAYKGKAFVKDDAYTEKAKVKKSEMKLTSKKPLAETKKKKVEEKKKIKEDRSFAQDAAETKVLNPNIAQHKISQMFEKKPAGKNKHDDEAADKKLVKKMVKSSALKEDAESYFWIPAAAAGLGIAGTALKSIVSIMKKNNLKGIEGLMKAFGIFKQDIGKSATHGSKF